MYWGGGEEQIVDSPFNNSKKCFKINPYPTTQNKNIHFYNTDENTKFLNGDFTIHCKIKCVSYIGHFIPFGLYNTNPKYYKQWIATILRDSSYNQLSTVWKWYADHSAGSDAEYAYGRILITDRQVDIYDTNDIIISRKDGTIYYFLNGILIGSRKSKWTTNDFIFEDFIIGGLFSSDDVNNADEFYADDIIIIVGKCLFTTSFNYNDNVYISDYIKYYLYNGIKLEK